LLIITLYDTSRPVNRGAHEQT